MNLRLPLNSWFSCLHFSSPTTTSTGITGICHHVWQNKTEQMKKKKKTNNPTTKTYKSTTTIKKNPIAILFFYPLFFSFLPLPSRFILFGCLFLLLGTKQGLVLSRHSTTELFFVLLCGTENGKLNLGLHTWQEGALPRCCIISYLPTTLCNVSGLVTK